MAQPSCQWLEVFVRKTHISANFPAEPGPSPARGENLLPFPGNFTEGLGEEQSGGASRTGVQVLGKG